MKTNHHDKNSATHADADKSLFTAAKPIGRRQVIAGLLALPVAGWAADAGAQSATRNFNLGRSAPSTPVRPRASKPRKSPRAAQASDPLEPQIYGPMPNEQFPVPAVGRGVLPPEFWRAVVDDPTGEAPGTVVVDTPGHYLYLVLPDGKAWRYGVGVGRAGFEWQGRANIAWKRKWPTWTPPSAMIEREPHLEKFRDGMKPGLKNPLGARALYIHQNGVDTLYRAHGTNEPGSIGRSMSSGCIRMINQDVIHLYEQVHPPARILVLQGSTPLA